MGGGGRLGEPARGAARHHLQRGRSVRQHHRRARSPGHITIDTDAAGHGWFVDPTPNDNSEFTHAQNAAGTDLLTDPSNAAAGHLDLLTTVTHEMGHVLGLDDSTAASDANDLMYINLVDGERRLPDAADVAQANATCAPERRRQPSQAAGQARQPVAGTAGNDTIDAGHGGNILFGGAGADNFVFGQAPRSTRRRRRRSPTSPTTASPRATRSTSPR